MRFQPCGLVLRVEEVVADRARDDALPVLLHEDVPVERNFIIVKILLSKMLEEKISTKLLAF
jgi:hypothetical protein